MLASLVLVFARAIAVAVAVAAPPAEEIPIRFVLAVDSIGGGTRSPVFIDAIERARGRGAFRAPSEGDEVTLANGDKRAWKRVEAGADGVIPVRGGYAFASVDAKEAGVYLLDASGHRHVIVNGEPRIGDAYSLGFVRVPVALAAGRNDLLFKGGQGQLRAKLVPPAADLVIDDRESTLPDLIAGEPGPFPAGLTLLNATAEWRSGVTLDVAVAGGEMHSAKVPAIAPLAIRRVAFEIGAASGLEPGAKEVDARFTLRDASGREIHSHAAKLAVKKSSEPHKRTFVSGIDGSVQYFAVVPATGSGGSPPALVLTLHGAGVQATGQAACYAPRDWATIVAPTNRRVFGFDWEDWGRIDAMEALGAAEKLFGTDPRRTYVTGHSMGGHGAWALGAAYPGRFAAIAPSAGWSDFWSYTGAQSLAETDPVQAILSRAANASRTRLLDRNFSRAGVYVLHGDADETVPVREARAMRARLAEFHSDFAYYERPGAGHWWGNECVDWPPLVEFLKGHARPAPETVTSVAFTTVNPEITFQCDWVTLWAQERSLEPSRIEARIDEKAGKFDVKTENVAEFVLDLAPFKALPGRYEFQVDGATLVDEEPRSSQIRIQRGADRAWEPGAVGGGSWSEKGAHRAGPFKAAFNNRVAFVYGTRGSAEENAWAFAKARYDAETFYYRGNGQPEIVSDAEYVAEDRGRNVILYGNADTNAAWGFLLEKPPIEVRRGEIRVGEKRLTGPDLACLFVWPRGDESLLVGVVAGTGLFGCRLTDQLPYFTSGIAYPDWTVIGADMLEVGVSGVRGAGFFGRDWSLEKGQSAWR